MTLRITSSDLEALRQLWGELAEFPVAQSGAALEHALARLGGLIGVERIWWIGTRHVSTASGVPWQGWQVMMLRYLNGTEDDRATVDRLMQRAQNNQAPRFHALRAALDERCHVERPCDLMTDAEWYRDWYYHEILKPVGQDGQMVGTYRIDDKLAAHVGMDRTSGARPFSDRDRDFLTLFLAGAPALQRELFRSHGLEGGHGVLSPRARSVLKLLLTDLSEKQIAAELGLTVRTTHQNVTAVLRHFGVSGRRGLMALFLRQRPGAL